MPISRFNQKEREQDCNVTNLPALLVHGGCLSTMPLIFCYPAEKKWEKEKHLLNIIQRLALNTEKVRRAYS